MGLTKQSTGIKVLESGLKIDRQNTDCKIIALSGNPNVGKSTVFNSLTGLNQHTGNWPGKTVVTAQGKCKHKDMDFIIVDIPGTYSLMSNSVEEEVARDFICFGNPDVTIVVADATCLERNLNLVLQTLEITDNVVVCINLIDEAKRKKINININKLSKMLGVPVVATNARNNEGLHELMDTVYALAAGRLRTRPLQIRYDEAIEQSIAIMEKKLSELLNNKLNPRWVALKLLDGEPNLLKAIDDYLGFSLRENAGLFPYLEAAKNHLTNSGIQSRQFRDQVVSKLIRTAEIIYQNTVTFHNMHYNSRDRKIDSILTSKKWGIPVMIGLLVVVFWLTITGANIPSKIISAFLFHIEDLLTRLFNHPGIPSWIYGLLVKGIYRTMAWVVSVMLPPMAIFFPLFTLLEDLGYLPRIAFNLDNFFKKACAHGKQALTMCMGFGCNAAGIIGCRIIDSPRERLIAIITNNFVPCNGRFPTLIAIITMFFAGFFTGPFKTIISTLLLTGLIIFGVIMTLLVSKILSRTLLKGIPSSFTLELPPYRKPQTGKVIVRSIFDRTLFVLGRAVSVAAPAGAVIWVFANIQIGELSLLSHCAAFLDPFARLLGMDGYILMAFILGFPANEIVIPIIIMSYMSAGSMLELDSLTELRHLLVSNGWTWLTALCVMLFSLMHWPCGTTCWTIKKETQSLKWTLASILVPTMAGIIVCFIVAGTVRLLGLV